MKLGFGTWQLGGECTFAGRQTGWGKIDFNAAIEAIEYALDCGIRFFDTAQGYGKGTSEEILGNVISKNSEVEVCTKFGSYESDSGEAFLDFSKERLIKSVEESLTRLKTERLNTVLLHGPGDDFEYSNFDVSGFDELKKAGKIQHYGVSVRSLKGAINVVNHGFGDTLEAIYNILDRRVEDYIFEKENFKKYNFIARVPLASGFLSAKYLQNSDVIFENTDIRSAINVNDRAWYKASVSSLAFLNDLPGGISVSALRYVLFEENVGQVIPGMRNIQQVKNNLQAYELGKLDDDIIEKIRMALPSTNPKWLF